jgi:hypothetical protein
MCFSHSSYCTDNADVLISAKTLAITSNVSEDEETHARRLLTYVVFPLSSSHITKCGV